MFQNIRTTQEHDSRLVQWILHHGPKMFNEVQDKDAFIEKQLPQSMGGGKVGVYVPKQESIAVH